MSLKEKAKTALLMTYPAWSRIVPSSYFPYKFQGGWIYLNIRESRFMLRRVLGRYEPSKHRALRHFLRPGSVFVDVGSNKGDFSLAASPLIGAAGKILAFEPHPENCHWIRKSIEKNRYRNIELFELALSDTNGTAVLHVGHRSGWHSLIDGLETCGDGTMKVGLRRLDDLLPELPLDRAVDVVKIDVEGAEMQVLQGAEKSLIAGKETVLLLDIHPHLGVNVKEVCDFLRQLGFLLYAERPPFDIPLDPVPDLDSLVAVRRPRPHRRN